MGLLILQYYIDAFCPLRTDINTYALNLKHLLFGIKFAIALSISLDDIPLGPQRFTIVYSANLHISRNCENNTIINCNHHYYYLLLIQLSAHSNQMLNPLGTQLFVVF